MYDLQNIGTCTPSRYILPFLSSPGQDNYPGREGGTWMGVSRKGRLGFLLNILEQTVPSNHKKGRGDS